MDVGRPKRRLNAIYEHDLTAKGYSNLRRLFVLNTPLNTLGKAMYKNPLSMRFLE